MPIFEYICPKCAHEFELLIFDRDEPVDCPECGCKKPRKQMSVFAHKSDSGFTSSASGSECGGCTASSCSGCSH
ncbi:MAG: zinc ribbon domain-containing protein [Deltaproteobacteria bacterium]|nr:zinc ribbon domain-containing protein [Deltaproteobacteria bacterium]MBW1871876.1 zinc ribbon domain-containing protein [Deltaproteobacteria bacterium]